MESDRVYWERRAEEELTAALIATDSNVAAIHRRMATYYATKSLGESPMSEVNAMPIAL